MLNLTLIGMIGVSTRLTGGAVCIVGAPDVKSPLVSIDEYDNVVSGAERPVTARGLDSQALTSDARTPSSSVVLLLGSAPVDTTAGELKVAAAGFNDNRSVMDRRRGVESSTVVSYPWVVGSATIVVGFRPSAGRLWFDRAELVFAPSVLSTSPSAAHRETRRVVEVVPDTDSACVLPAVDWPE